MRLGSVMRIKIADNLTSAKIRNAPAQVNSEDITLK